MRTRAFLTYDLLVRWCLLSHAADWRILSVVCSFLYYASSIGMEEENYQVTRFDVDEDQLAFVANLIGVEPYWHLRSNAATPRLLMLCSRKQIVHYYLRPEMVVWFYKSPEMFIRANLLPYIITTEEVVVKAMLLTPEGVIYYSELSL